MTPQMIETLYRISLLHAPEPKSVFQQIAETVAAMYGNTMTMINLVEGDCLRFHTVVNTHPAFANVGALNMQATLCQFALQGNRPLLIQNAMHHPDFCHHPVVALQLRRYLGVPICSPDGNVVGTLCLLDDHTEQSLGEDDIQFFALLAMRVSAELERERLIEARVAEQRAYVERLLETARERRRFVSMVIHDLRHPLTAMRASLHLLRIETGPKERLAQIKALENRTRALGTLLDELVLYDRIEAGSPLLQLKSCELEPLIRACIAEVVGLNGEDTVPIFCEITSDLGVAHIDSGKLKHILLNLIANALKFTQEGHVMVRAARESIDHWRLEVEDTGIGMTSVEQQRAFEEYFSGTGGADGSVGLGLTIAHRLCTTLQAQVTLHSVPGQGTCFHLLFPYRLAPSDSHEESRA